MKHFRQAIQIDNNITFIMSLPCVIGCMKQSAVGEPLNVNYLLTGDTICKHLPWGAICKARKGEWLCEDEQGFWHLLTDEEHRKEAMQ